MNNKKISEKEIIRRFKDKYNRSPTKPELDRIKSIRGQFIKKHKKPTEKPILFFGYNTK